LPTTTPETADISAPMSMSMAPIMLTAISGREVPMATTVSPMKRWEILKWWAMFSKPPTASWEPSHSPTRPNVRKMIGWIMCLCRLVYCIALI